MSTLERCPQVGSAFQVACPHSHSDRFLLPPFDFFHKILPSWNCSGGLQQCSGEHFPDSARKACLWAPTGGVQSFHGQRNPEIPCSCLWSPPSIRVWENFPFTCHLCISLSYADWSCTLLLSDSRLLQPFPRYLSRDTFTCPFLGGTP